MIKGNLTMGAEQSGDWYNFDRFFNHIAHSKKLKRDIKYSFRDFLRSYQWWAIKGMVTSGAAVGSPWPSRQLDGGPAGIRSGKYHQAIQNMKISMRGDSVRLAFSPGDLRRRSKNRGYTLAKYMVIFENGSSKQPARPLWGPSFNRAGGLKRINRLTLKAIKRSLNHSGFHNITIRRT